MWKQLSSTAGGNSRASACSRVSNSLLMKVHEYTLYMYTERNSHVSAHLHSCSKLFILFFGVCSRSPGVCEWWLVHEWWGNHPLQRCNRPDDTGPEVPQWHIWAMWSPSCCLAHWPFWSCTWACLHVCTGNSLKVLKWFLYSICSYFRTRLETLLKSEGWHQNN